MTAREVAKWHGKACVVTLKQGSVLVCELLKPWDWQAIAVHLKTIKTLIVLECREIKSIKARRK